MFCGRSAKGWLSTLHLGHACAVDGPKLLHSRFLCELPPSATFLDQHEVPHQVLCRELGRHS